MHTLVEYTFAAYNIDIIIKGPGHWEQAHSLQISLGHVSSSLQYQKKDSYPD